ncbi:MAG TPA: hypothetical protein VM242_11855, partial [Acidimicrobiales bacterium]|nr:hypothetical protein [Acidimicrobiales bacterium]
GGAGGHVGDGATYDPATDTWEPLPEFDTLAPRGGHAMAWTGQEVLIWGGGDDRIYGNGARYRQGDGWELLPRAPGDGTANGATAWTGEELLLWGGGAGGGSAERGRSNQGLRFRP